MEFVVQRYSEKRKYPYHVVIVDKKLCTSAGWMIGSMIGVNYIEFVKIAKEGFGSDNQADFSSIESAQIFIDEYMVPKYIMKTLASS